MNRKIAVLFSLVTLALILLAGRAQLQTLQVWSCLAILALIYLAVIWTPPSWWTRGKYILAVSLATGLVAAVYLINPRDAEIPASLLLVPFILLLARDQLRFRGFVEILAVAMLVVMGILAPNATFIWVVFPVVISLYMSIRAVNIYKAAYSLSQQNVAELKVAHQELQQTYASLQEAAVHSMRYAALAERARLAREIHDGLGHQLTSLIVQLQALEIMLPGDPDRAAQVVPGMLEVTRKAMAEVRRAIETWREEDRDTGLVALQGLVSQTAAVSPFIVDFQHEKELSDWPEELSVALYRILQEALTNIMRHAQASTVSIRLQESDCQVILTVSDDGRYTEEKPLAPGYGIQGILERTRALGGDCQITQNHPHGMQLQVRLPIQQPQALPAGVEVAG